MVQEVADWLKHLGMKVRVDEGECRGSLGDLHVLFRYRESARTVQRYLRITDRGKRVGIIRLRLIAASIEGGKEAETGAPDLPSDT